MTAADRAVIADMIRSEVIFDRIRARTRRKAFWRKLLGWLA